MAACAAEVAPYGYNVRGGAPSTRRCAADSLQPIAHRDDRRARIVGQTWLPLVARRLGVSLIAAGLLASMAPAVQAAANTGTARGRPAPTRINIPMNAAAAARTTLDLSGDSRGKDSDGAIQIG
jgi:hypothetical protein